MKVQVETNPKLRATIEKNVAARQQKTEAGDDDNTVRMMKAAMAKPPTIFRPRDGMAGPSLETSDTVAPAASQHEVESKSDAIDAPSAMSGPSTASFVEAEAESEVSSRIASPAKATNIEAESDSHAGPSSPLPRSNTATRKLKNRQTTVWTSGDNAHFRAGFENPQEWDANIADLGRMGAIETAREREAERREALKLDAEKIEALKLAKEKNRAMTERALTGELETIVEQSDDDSFNTVIAQSQRSVSRESTLSAASTGGRPTMTGSATVVDLRSAAAAAGGDFDAASKEAFDDEATQVDRSLGPAQGLGDKKA